MPPNRQLHAEQLLAASVCTLLWNLGILTLALLVEINRGSAPRKKRRGEEPIPKLIPSIDELGWGALLLGADGEEEPSPPWSPSKDDVDEGILRSEAEESLQSEATFTPAVAAEDISQSLTAIEAQGILFCGLLPCGASRRHQTAEARGVPLRSGSLQRKSRRQAYEVEEPWEDSAEVDRQIAGLLAKNLVRVVQSQRVPVSSLQTGQRLSLDFDRGISIGGFRVAAEDEARIEETGIVRAIERFGAFVDVGAQRDGLVPIQLISEKYVADVYEEIMPGQKVTVWVEEVKSNGRLTLTMLPKYLRSLAA
eukprot:s507_g3.t1